MFSKKGTRSQDFSKYISNLLEKGKNFYSNLSSLFRTNIKVREGILLLNTAIVQQNDNNSLSISFLREDLVYADIRKALKTKKEVKKKFQVIKELVAKKLAVLGLIISPTGLLVKGVYTRELFL